ncbi:ATP-binding protein [Erysipelotrichaceae bacterium 51-3]
MEKLIERNEYLDKIAGFKDKDLIKILTGVRRSGKSTLLRLYQKRLMEQGVKEEQIISVNMEDLRFEDLHDYHKLYDYICSHLVADQMNYIFIDEIQEIESFEKALNSLQLKENTDIYITGSNSRMFSGELSTRLSGRYVEIPVYPFAFAEFLQMNPGNKEERFMQFMKTGGLPAAIDLDEERRTEYLRGIFNTVLLKDIVERRRFSDVVLLETVSRYLADNISNPTSAKRIADYLTSAGRKTTPMTIDNYLGALEDGFLVFAVSRYDLKGKRILERQEKYYFGDLGLRYFLSGNQFRDLGRVLENVVFLELKKRGYTIHTGRAGQEEVDFMATKGDKVYYYQVCASVLDENTRERELRPFMKIQDNYPKILLTLDKIPMTDRGIIHQNIIDFLLEERA